jgi:hypothetical protein
MKSIKDTVRFRSYYSLYLAVLVADIDRDTFWLLSDDRGSLSSRTLLNKLWGRIKYEKYQR